MKYSGGRDIGQYWIPPIFERTCFIHYLKLKAKIFACAKLRSIFTMKWNGMHHITFLCDLGDGLNLYIW